MDSKQPRELSEVRGTAGSDEPPKERSKVEHRTLSQERENAADDEDSAESYPSEGHFEREERIEDISPAWRWLYHQRVYEREDEARTEADIREFLRRIRNP